MRLRYLKITATCTATRRTSLTPERKYINPTNIQFLLYTPTNIFSSQQPLPRHFLPFLPLPLPSHKKKRRRRRKNTKRKEGKKVERKEREDPETKKKKRTRTTTRRRMTTPYFWRQPLHYLRWASHEKPAIFYSIAIGTLGPLTLFVVPPIRHRLGDGPRETIPLTYPGMSLNYIYMHIFFSSSFHTFLIKLPPSLFVFKIFLLYIYIYKIF